MTSPTQDPKTNALGILSYLAEVNTADVTNAGLDVYATAGVVGPMDRNLASYNSALNSTAIKGANVDTTAEVQRVVDAYNAIRSYTHWLSDAVAPIPTAAQYAAIGVTGVAGSVNATGTALHLLNDSVYRANPDATDSVAELQTMVTAAKHVIAAAGGTAKQAAALILQDFTSLGVTGVTTDNLTVVQRLIRSVTSDAQVDTGVEIQNLINAKLESRHDMALATIQQAAQSDTATGHLGPRVYANAGVTGVDATNLASINSALDSAKVNGLAADTTAEVQAIVNAYKAVLASADAVHGNIHLPLTLAQYAAIGVTGVSGAVAQPFIRTDGGAFLFGNAADQNADVQAGSVTDPVTGLTLNIVVPNGSDWHLLNDVVDASAKTAVDKAQEVQAIASAANHVIQAAGGTLEQAAAVTLADLQALGIHGVTADTLVTVQTGLALTGSDYAVDTQAELQSLVEAALAAKPSALHTISAAADSDTAAFSMLRLELFGLAGVTGVNLGNFSSIYSALDSEPVDGTRADSTAEVQSIVNAYNAILRSADGVAGNSARALSGAQFSAVGVTGVSGLASEGTALHLLNDVVDSSAKTGVDTVPELQAMANAAAHVIAAAGGTLAAARAITHADLFALGIAYGDESNITNLQDALHALTSSAAVDTRFELSNLAQATQLTVHFAELLSSVEPPQPIICYFDPLQNTQPSSHPVMVA
jgi:hypothetical protein